jgi:tripartite-type tricarboxylate transporter receptor subunit TctC
VLALATLPVALTTASAQDKFPSRAVRIVSPFPAGAVSDISLRILAERLGPRLGTQVVIENVPTGGGVAAAKAVITSPPDGHTLALLSNATAVSAALFKKLPYDPLKDFVPVGGVSDFSYVFLTNAKSNLRSLADVIAAARANPGKLNVGTTTVGSTNHLAANLWRSMSGLDVVIVPFRTPGDLVTAVIRGDVDVVIQSFGALKSYVEGGQLRALASTNPQRAAYARDIPTMDEAGVKGFDVVTWNGFYAPANTPADVAAQLNREIRATLGDAELIRRFHDLGLETLPSTPEALQARMQDEIAKWGKVIAEAGIPKQ